MSYTDLIDDLVRGWSRDFRHSKSGISITKDIFDIWRVGIVYILKNPAFPNLVKIGITMRDEVQIRMSELYRFMTLRL